MQDTPRTALPGPPQDRAGAGTQPWPAAPVPGPGSLQRLTVPDHAPPYDDEREGDPQPVKAGNAPLDQPVAAGAEPRAWTPDGSGVPRAGTPDGTRLPPPAAPDEDGVPRAGTPDGTRLPPAAAPDGGGPAGTGASGWPSRFAQVLAETLAGARPARQLTPWTSEEARQRIRQLGQTVACDQRPTVRRIMTSAPAEDVLELTAVVGFGPRVRVLALRLERDQPGPANSEGGHWCCTTIESA